MVEFVNMCVWLLLFYSVSLIMSELGLVIYFIF